MDADSGAGPLRKQESEPCCRSSSTPTPHCPSWVLCSCVGGVSSQARRRCCGACGTPGR